MDADIEKKIEYEIRCSELIQKMFILKPDGPGGDTWDSSAGVNEKDNIEIVRKESSQDTAPFFDFVKYKKPVLICHCPSLDREERKRSKSRHLCSCWERSTGSHHETSLRKILNTIRTPHIFKTKEGSWLKQISSEPITRKGVLEMNEILDNHLEKQLAQEKGVCPVRRHLFSSIFDELIRQEMIISPERGHLLMRVKDELKMSLMAYEALYEQGLNYGMQKRLAAERTMNLLQDEHDAVLNETIDLKNKIRALHEEFKDQKMQSELSVKGVRNRAKLEVDQLTDIKLALQYQLNQVIPDIEKIEKERRLRNLH